MPRRGAGLALALALVYKLDNASAMTSEVCSMAETSHLQEARTGCPFHNLKDMLRTAGLRPTRQRIALGWLLFGKGDRHVSAEALFEEAQKARVPVSLATIYNTLHQFTSAGFLREVAVEGAKAYFDTNIGNHFHFYVEGEGRLIDLPNESIVLDSLPPPPEGFEVAGVDVVVRLRAKSA